MYQVSGPVPLSKVVGWFTYRRDLAVLKGADDTVDLKLTVDICLLLLDVGGLVDLGGRHLARGLGTVRGVCRWVCITGRGEVRVGYHNWGYQKGAE